jgi:hypothetical protein
VTNLSGRERARPPARSAQPGEGLREAVLCDWMLDDHLDEVERAWLPT